MQKGSENMNRIFKVIWSKTKNCYVVASELAKGRTKAASTGDKAKRLALAAITALMLLPVGGYSYAADTTKVDSSTSDTAVEVYTKAGTDAQIEAANKYTYRKAAELDKKLTDQKTSTALHVSKDGNLIVGTKESQTVKDMEIRGKFESGSISTGDITSTGDVTVKGKMAADGVTDETTKDGTYIKQNNTVGNNLVSLDKQVKANDDRITNVKEYLEQQTSDKYVSKADAAVQDGAIVKAANTIGDNVTKLDAALAKETAARIGADKAQDAVIQQVNQNAANGIATLATAYNNEVASREAADNELNERITNEANAIHDEIKAGDTALDNRITAVKESLQQEAADTYVSKDDASVQDGAVVKANNKVGQNVQALDTALAKETAARIGADKAQDQVIAQVNQNMVDGFNTINTNMANGFAALNAADAAEKEARIGADKKLAEAVNSGLSLSDDNVLQKNTTTVADDGTVTTSKSDANEMILNKGNKNQITLNEKGIKVGTNSSVMDADGIYTGGDTFDAAKAAMSSDGQIKGANGKFTVDASGNTTVTSLDAGTGTIQTKGDLYAKDATFSGDITAKDATLSGDLSAKDGTFSGDLSAKDGTFSGDVSAKDVTATGTLQGAEVTDGTATMKNGNITGVKDLSAETITTSGDATIGGDLTVKGKLNVDEIDLTKNGIVGDNNVTASTKVAAGEITGYKKATSTKDGSEKEAAFDYDENGTSTWAKATDADGNWNKSTMAVEGSGVTSKVIDSEKNSNLVTQTSTQSQSTLTDADKNTNTATQSAAESSSTLKDKDGKTSTFKQRVGEILNQINSSDTVFSKVDQKVDNISSEVTDGTNTTSSTQTTTDITNTANNGTISNTAKNIENTASENITNTAKNGSITNDAKNIANIASETLSNSAKNITNTTTDNMTNTIGKNLTTTVGGDMSTEVTGNQSNTVKGTLTETVTGKVTEDYKSDLSTKVGGNETHYVAGSQTNTVSGDRTVSVKGTETENFNAQVTNVKTDQRTSVGGNQTNIVAGNQQNTVSGSKTETVKGSVTEKYGSQATTVDGDQSTNVGGNQSNVVTGNQTNTISGSKTETVKGAVSETYGSQTTKVNGDQSTTVTGKQTNSITGDQVNTIGGSQTTTVTGDVTEDYKANLSTTVGGNQTTTVTGDSSLTAENINNTAKNKITNKAIDVETDATSSIVQKVANDYGSNTSTQLSYQTTEEMSQADGKTASYLRGAAEEKSQLTDGDKKTTIDTVAGQTNTNITEGKNISNSLQKADQIASSVTDGTNTTVVNQDAKSLASSITDGTKANNSSNTVDKSEQLIKASDTQYSATSKTATKMEDALVSGGSVIDVIKNLDDAANPFIGSAVTDGTNSTGVTQTAKDITNTAKNGTIANEAKDITNNATENMTNTVGKDLTTTVGGEMKTTVTGDVKEDYKANLSTTVGGNQTTTVTGDSSLSAKNITNTATEKLSNSATDIENKASTSILNQVGDNTSWKMTDGQVVESIKGADGQTNTTTTTADDTYQSVQKGNNVLAKRTSSTNDNLNITDGTNTYSKITTATSNKQTVTNGTETASTNLTKSASNTYITNGTQTVINHIAADTKNTVMNEGSNGSRQEQTASQILDRVTDGTNTNSTTTTASGTTFENTAHNTALTEMTKHESGDFTKTTISGNTLTTGQATMDYAEVMKDLGVHGNATVDGNTSVGGNLSVTGTSTLTGDVTMKSNATVEKNLTVKDTTTTDKLVVNNGATIKGGTTTDTIHVTSTSTFDGAATFKDVVTMEKDLSVGGNATVAGSMTASSYKVGDKTYISKSGINANNQKVVNVAAGDLSANSTDAVNGAQLYQTNERVTGVENRVGTVENRVDKLDSRVDKVGANAAALANLHPLEFDADSKWNIAAAVGGYKGETATAIGAFYRPNENVMVNVSSSFGTGENMYGGGISLRIGQGGNKARRNATNGLTDREKAMQKQIDSLTNRLDALLSVINPNMSKDFPDVPENHWAYEAVSRLAGNGVIQGYEDGKYHGDRTMTRYEMAEIIYNALSKGAKAEKKLVEEFKPELQAMAAQKKA